MGRSVDLLEMKVRMNFEERLDIAIRNVDIAIGIQIPINTLQGSG